MEQHLVILLFFTGIIPLALSVPRKYYLIKQGKTWSNAQAYCRAMHADLAIIDSADNVIRLNNEAQRQQFISSAWVGLSLDINKWLWSMGNEPLGSTVYWAAMEPNNADGIESCGVISPVSWNDMPCSTNYNFLCYDGTKTGNAAYVYITVAMTWFDAQTYCRTHYTDLASARSATENSILVGIIPGGSWFGLFRDSWRWADHTLFSTISWLPRKPDNFYKNENCGYIINGKTDDAPCSDIRPFYCYSLITGRQQIIKVKVQSTQNVNDPAVKVVILDQFKQKLKDHGMAENITVKWVEQPDGNVFHMEK